MCILQNMYVRLHSYHVLHTVRTNEQCFGRIIVTSPPTCLSFEPFAATERNCNHMLASDEFSHKTFEAKEHS